jgi:hypothetical protein
MAALLWIAAALIGVVLLVLLTPWHVRVRGRTMPLDLRLRLSLLGGLAPGIPIPIRRSKDRDRPRKKKRKPRKDRRYRGTPRGLRDLILGLLSALRLRNLRLSGRIGTPGPGRYRHALGRAHAVHLRPLRTPSPDRRRARVLRCLSRSRRVGRPRDPAHPPPARGARLRLGQPGLAMIPRRRLSPVLRHGDRHIAVLEEWTVSAWARGHRLGGSGEKRPLAILIGGADGLAIHGPDGAPMTPAEIDRLLPGAVAEFVSAATRDTVTPEDNEEET